MRKKVLLASLVVLLFIVTTSFVSIKPTLDISKITKANVKITNFKKSSGGTGVVLLSSPGSSFILTNRHVCELLETGGLVITDDNEDHTVLSFRASKRHDLCLVAVADDLGVNTDIAKIAPRPYEDATIVGHPRLYPTIITYGHFSHRQIIQVSTGSRACTEADLQDPNTGLLCALFGAVPTVETFESVLISATIMPGSSGSAVYNSKGQVAALVFAGSGELGYAMAVPLEFIINFLFEELQSTVK